MSCFLIHPSFFTPLHRSPYARSILASKCTNFAMPALTLVLTCNTALFWWPRKLKDVPFGAHASCSDIGLWRHITPTFKTMALRSSTPTKACSFGWTQLMPLVNSRTIYQCAVSVMVRWTDAYAYVNSRERSPHPPRGMGCIKLTSRWVNRCIPLHRGRAL